LTSTAAVYGRPGARRIAEDAALRPVTPYGTSKMMAEMMLADAARAHDLHYVALRSFNVAGSDALGRTGSHASGARNLIKAACETALGEARELELYGASHATADGSLVRDYVHVCDLARAHVAALQHLRAGGESETLNCGYGHGYTAHEVIGLVKRVSGRDFAVRDIGCQADEPVELVLEAGRLRERLGWTPRLDDLETMVAQTFEAEASRRIEMALAS
jgi:UDP-glucose 4-epimerase